MGFFETKEFWAALIQGLATLSAVGVAAWFAFVAIPASEVRRQRLACIASLVSSRYLLAHKEAERAKLTFSDKAPFLAALNSVPAFFGADDRVMAKLRDVRRVGGEEKNGAMMSLIREMARVANLPLDHVEDNDLLTPFIT